MQKNTSWTDSARQAILDFIERSTRFSPRNIDLHSPRVLEVTFQVEVSHLLSCNTSTTTIQGIGSPGPNDLQATSSSDLGEKIDAVLDEALSVPAVYEYLKATVSQNGYGKYREAYTCGTYRRRLLRTSNCHGCNASGSVNCNICLGTGKSKCPTCLGSREERKSEFNSAQSRYVHFKVRCHRCHGIGTINCLHCSCTGKVQCRDCGGKRVLTDVVSFNYMVTPKYRPVLTSVTDADAAFALSIKRDWSGIAKHAELTTTEVYIDPESKIVRELASFNAPLYSAHVSVEGHKSRMVVFGNNCEISDAGGLIETLVHEDLKTLESTSNQTAIRTFMQSEVHRKMVETIATMAPANDAEMISDQLAKAVSPAYVDKSVKALDAATQKIVKSWSSTINWLACAVFVYLGYLMVLDKLYLMAGLTAGGLYLTALVLSFMASWLHLVMLGGARLSRFSKRRGRTSSNKSKAQE